jgi:hypothetical protein
MPAYKHIALDLTITQISRQVYDEAKAATRTQRLSEPLTIYSTSDSIMVEEFRQLAITAHGFDQYQQAKTNGIAEMETDNMNIPSWIITTCSKNLLRSLYAILDNGAIRSVSEDEDEKMKARMRVYIPFAILKLRRAPAMHCRILISRYGGKKNFGFGTRTHCDKITQRVYLVCEDEDTREELLKDIAARLGYVGAHALLRPKEEMLRDRAARLEWAFALLDAATPKEVAYMHTFDPC